MNKVDAKRLLISILEKEIPDLTKEHKHKITEILLDYISLLNDGKIEKANELIRQNRDKLEMLV